jgi:acetyltransferase-like isoleucine patch superfamily enzyme
MRRREVLNKIEFIFIFFSKLFKILPMGLRLFFFYRFRKIGGYLGIALRYILLRSIAPKCGRNVSIFQNCYILNPHKLELGDNVSIHPLCYIDAAGGITIGNDVSIAHGVSIMSSTHVFADATINIKDQPVIFKSTHIADNIWIGAKAMIMGGITVETGAIIGSSSVVTKNIPSNVIVAGNPAKELKRRNS